jgi:uncharacterized membrane protein
MGAESFHLWFLVIAAAVLAGWWLAVRPRASYCAVSTTMSFLIVLMAVLLCVLAVSGQHGTTRPTPVQQAVTLGR